MEITIINGSPRLKKSNSEILKKKIKLMNTSHFLLN